MVALADKVDGMKKKPPPDQHRHPSITLRLPPEASEVLRRLARKNDRTLTAEIRRALRAYAEANGEPWPENLS